MSSAEKVKQIIREKFDVNEIKDWTLLKEELNANSLDKVELIISFENEFGIIIHDEDAAKIETVGNAITAIDERVAMKVQEDELSI